MSRFLEQFRMAGGDVEGVMERFMDDEELLRECLEQFVTADDFTKLENAISERNYKEAFEYAHALKGVIGNLGINPLYTSVCVLVESLRGEVYDKLSEELEAILKEKEIFMEKYDEMK